MATKEQFRGCLLGLALGDALGAPYEGGIIEKSLWRVIGRTWRGEMRWTDDTQMTMDLIEAYLERSEIVPLEIAMRFYKSYRWSRGYGRSTPRVLKRIARGVPFEQAARSVFREGSLGNGAAMRSPILALIFEDQLALVIEAVQATAVITHVHPLGIEGAVLLATVTWLSAKETDSLQTVETVLNNCRSEGFRTRLQKVRMWIESGEEISIRDVARDLGRGVAAEESCVTAMYLALKYRDRSFLEMVRFITSLGGDTDTIGAMAGAVWGVINGSARLPSESLAKLEYRNGLQSLADCLFTRVTDNKCRMD